MSRDWTIGISLALLCLFNTISMHQGFDGGTATSRFNLLHSIYLYGRLDIDPFHENTYDKAFINGHYYSNKAPLTALLALPGYAAAMQICYWLGYDHVTEGGQLLLSWISTVLSVGLINAIGAIFHYFWLRRFFDAWPATVATIGLYVGGLSLPYSTMLLSHAIVISSVSIMLFLLYEPDCFKTHAKRRTVFLAGLVGGAAIASEYSSGLVVLGILLFLLYDRKTFIPWVSFGVFLGVAPVFIMNWLCFNSPLRVGYDYPVYFFKLNRGFYGIELPPSWENIFILFFSPTRGLFVLMPSFLLSTVGLLYSSCKISKDSRVVLLLLLAITHIYILSGYWEPGGGLAIGPRYFSPTFPILSFLFCLVIKQWPKVCFALVLLGYWFVFTITFTGAQVPVAFSKVHIATFEKLYFDIATYNIPSMLGFSAITGFCLLGTINLAVCAYCLKTANCLQKKDG